ncbi:MAG TPA: transcriptional regulator [Thermomicrobiales bacterium]|nr:transcriptional regulator [Thermomicrobiales bacterium]
MLDTSTRLLKLLSLLQTRRTWTGAELAERLQVSGRTVRNDIDRLRELGYPVDATRGGQGGYQLGAGAELPPLLLDDEEAVAIVLALSVAQASGVAGTEEASARALGKIQRVLPTRLRRRSEALRAFAVRVPSEGDRPVVESETLALLANACRDHEMMRLSYRKHDGERIRRMVEPHRLVAWGDRWYLVAWDLERTDWRTWRADRIERIDPTGRVFRERELPDPDITSYLASNVSRASWRYTARIEIEAPADEIRARIDAATGVVTPISADRCVLESGADSLWTIALWCAALDRDFRVEGPPELVEYVRLLADRYARAAGAA